MSSSVNNFFEDLTNSTNPKYMSPYPNTQTQSYPSYNPLIHGIRAQPPSSNHLPGEIIRVDPIFNRQPWMLPGCDEYVCIGSFRIPKL